MPGELAELVLMTESLGLGETTSRATDSSLSLSIQRVRAGDTAAFEQIIDCYQRKVMTTAWRMLGNREDASDAAQEVFLRAYKYLGSFNVDQDFGGWLYRIIMNVCRDHARRRGHADKFVSLEAERESGKFETMCSDEDVEAGAIKKQQLAMIADALSTLSKKEREALVLRDLEGLETEEVARVLGSSPTTVRSQISSARVKIREYRDRALKRSGGGRK